MDLVTIGIIAIGLSMDSFAVSIASGVILKQVKLEDAGLIALFMGGFQSLMVIVGYLLGTSFNESIQAWDHWIAFGLLAVLGGKMIIEGMKHESERDFCPTKLTVLSLLAFATSIDALAVGISFAFLTPTVARPAVIIGIVTIVFSLVGVFLGANVKDSRKYKVELIGGVILIGIGIKILLDHLVFCVD